MFCKLIIKININMIVWWRLKILCDFNRKCNERFCSLGYSQLDALDSGCGTRCIDFHMTVFVTLHLTISTFVALFAEPSCESSFTYFANCSSRNKVKIGRLFYYNYKIIMIYLSYIILSILLLCMCVCVCVLKDIPYKSYLLLVNSMISIADNRTDVMLIAISAR